MIGFEVSITNEKENYLVSYGHIYRRHLAVRTKEEAETMRHALFAAYSIGKADMREEFRNLLGIKEED